VPDSTRYAPPEVVKSGWDTIKRHPITAVDAYSFGSLIYEVFNGAFIGGDQLALAKNIPPIMKQSYKRLINTNPKARLSIGHFLEQGSRSGGFFDSPLIHMTQGIESLGMKTEQEREEFLRFVIQLPI
jgi:SCY1-like protein 1